MDSAAETKCFLAAEVVRKFGQVRLKVVGESMLPALRPGDEILVHPQSLRRLRPGEIVQFRRGPHLITHRVVEVRPDHLITRGDAACHPDAPVKEEELLGRVISVTRNGRAVDPALTPARRLTGWILRRHPLGSRILLRLHRMKPGLM